MPDEILIDDLTRVVSGYGICDILDISSPTARVIARVDPAGPQDLCVEQDDKCWVVESSSTVDFLTIRYNENGEEVFNRSRVQNATWPASLLFTPETFNWFLDADGSGNLYFVKFNRNDGTFSVSNPDPTISIQRTTTANSHATADISIATNAPSGPAGFSFYRSGRVVDVEVQESGLLALVNWTYADTAVGGTLKTVAGVMVISSSLVASTGVIPDSAIQWTPVGYPLGDSCKPLADGAIVWFTRGTNKVAKVSSLGTISSESTTAILQTPTDWRFDASGNLWQDDGSGAFKEYSSALADVTPSWLSSLSPLGASFIVTSSGHRFAYFALDGLDTVYRTIRCSDGTQLLQRICQTSPFTDQEFAVDCLFTNFHGTPRPLLDPGQNVWGDWQQTPDARVVARSPFFDGTGGWDRGIMKFSLDSILATVPVANSRLNGRQTRFQAFCCRGSYAHFSYSGW